ncbi:MAG: hypothetical protein FJ087_08560 [Deltaproteobacteria bacterium]|nr:hypothetical protein [Deltaproteobacteria bacterium]
MRTLVTALAMLSASSCDRDAPPSPLPAGGTVASASESESESAESAASASVRGALSRCSRPYRDDLTGLAFDHPCDLDVAVEFENPGSGRHVIKRRLLVTGQGEFEFVIDAWENTDRDDLEAWLDRFGAYATYEGSDAVFAHAGARRLRAFLATAGGECAPLKHYAIVATDSWVFRLMYVDGDEGASRDAWLRIVEGFEW